MSSEQLEQIKVKRAGHRGIVTKLIKECGSIIFGRVQEALNRGRTINRQLEDKLMFLQNLDGEILELVPVGKVKDEIMEADIISSKIVDYENR